MFVLLRQIDGCIYSLMTLKFWWSCTAQRWRKGVDTAQGPGRQAQGELARLSPCWLAGIPKQDAPRAPTEPTDGFPPAFGQMPSPWFWGTALPRLLEDASPEAPPPGAAGLPEILGPFHQLPPLQAAPTSCQTKSCPHTAPRSSRGSDGVSEMPAESSRPSSKQRLSPMTNWGGSPKAQLPGLEAAHNLRLVLHFGAPCGVSLCWVTSSPSSAYFPLFSPRSLLRLFPRRVLYTDCWLRVGSWEESAQDHLRSPFVTSIEVSFCPELVGPLWRRVQLFFFVLYCNIASEQCCDSFRSTAKGLSHAYACIHSPPNSPPIQAAR